MGMAIFILYKIFEVCVLLFLVLLSIFAVIATTGVVINVVWDIVSELKEKYYDWKYGE